MDQGNPHYSHIMDKFDCYDQQLVCGAAFTAELGDDMETFESEGGSTVRKIKSELTL